MSRVKVLALAVGLAVLTAPAAAWTTSYSWSSSGDEGPFGLFRSPFGFFGSARSLSSPFSSSSPYGFYRSPSTTSLFDDAFGRLFNDDIFSAKRYGTPPRENITDALVGSDLSYSGGLMGTPLQFRIDESDIGDIEGTQYNGEDAWKARVGQAGVYWDVILDETGTRILNVNQA